MFPTWDSEFLYWVLSLDFIEVQKGMSLVFAAFALAMAIEEKHIY